MRLDFVSPLFRSCSLKSLRQEKIMPLPSPWRQSMRISTTITVTWVPWPGRCHRDGERAWKRASEGPEISIQIQEPLVISDLNSNEHQCDLG